MLKKFNRVISLMLLLSFVLMLQVPAMAAPATNNLIPAGLDPNFDSGIKIGTNNKVDGVYLATGLQSTAYAYDETNQCIKITPTNTWTDFTLRGFSFIAGKSYVVAYDAKVDNASTTGVACSVELNGTDNATILPAIKTANATVKNDWTRVSKLLNCTSNTSSIHVVFRFKTTTETILVDNLAIYEINYDTNNLLNSNYSFEFAEPTIYNFEASTTAQLYNEGSDGNYSLKINTGSVTDGKLGKLCRFQAIPVTGSALYELSADVKLVGTEADSVKAYITAQLASSATATLGETVNGGSADLVSVNADKWTKVKRIYPVNILENPKLHVGIRLEGLPESGCDVLIDNFVVKKIADPVSIESCGTTIGTIAEYENKIAVSVKPDATTSVWMIVAKYNGEKLDNAVLKKVEITSAGQTIAHTFANMTDKENSAVYVWEAETMVPLLYKTDFRVAD